MKPTLETAQRKIIHIDMDCFYAAIEVRENPQLRGKPVAVGGQPGTRSVIATCSYEARSFGVRSAMPVTQALRLCPQLILVPGQMALYKAVSGAIRDIFYEYTDLVEPLSLDEAYLDVTGLDRHQGSATLMAQEMRRKIWQSQQLTASAGIAPNKFLAKVASDWNKPDGQCVIAPAEVADFVRDLPVKRLAGVGKVTAKKMQALGIATCGDLQKLPAERLEEHFGRFGKSLYDYARGIDHRPVKPDRIRKSLSVEDTFLEDVPDLEHCLLEINRLYEELQRRLERARKQQTLVPCSLFLKMRFADFSTTTVQKPYVADERKAWYPLCAEAWQRGNGRAVRLIGIGLQFYPPDQPEQLSLQLE